MAGSMQVNETFPNSACMLIRIAMVMCCLTWHLATCYSTQHWTASQRSVPHCLIALTSSSSVHHLALLRMTPCEKGNWLSGVESKMCVMCCSTHMFHDSCVNASIRKCLPFLTVIHVGCKESSRSAYAEAVWWLLVVLANDKGSLAASL